MVSRCSSVDTPPRSLGSHIACKGEMAIIACSIACNPPGKSKPELRILDAMDEGMVNQNPGSVSLESWRPGETPSCASWPLCLPEGAGGCVSDCCTRRGAYPPQGATERCRRSPPSLSRKKRGFRLNIFCAVIQRGLSCLVDDLAVEDRHMDPGLLQLLLRLLDGSWFGCAQLEFGASYVR